SHVNYSELLQLAKGWGNFIFYRINIWRLQKKSTCGPQAARRFEKDWFTTRGRTLIIGLYTLADRKWTTE
ncbi:MAG TPA: hypothetical protein H9873_02500, partial [Candidatus Dorea gallistercoris]|nr:hypothetical protein [Candidatus Dorea gallistercoris]